MSDGVVLTVLLLLWEKPNGGTLSLPAAGSHRTPGPGPRLLQGPIVSRGLLWETTDVPPHLTSPTR